MTDGPRLHFRFSERKATEATCYVLQKLGGKRDYLSVIKLLYLAERESLSRHHWPIIGDAYVSMPHGPVVSTVYSLIKDDRAWLEKTPQYWPDHIRQVDENDIEVYRPLAPHELTRGDMRVLDEVCARYAHLSRWQLRDLTHTLPEWEDPDGGSLPILHEDLLRIVGLSESEIESIRLDTEELRRIFADTHR